MLFIKVFNKHVFLKYQFTFFPPLFMDQFVVISLMLYLLLHLMWIHLNM
jgi:hypothetical protein